VIGATNAGKSSLFNGLLERDAAIVTPVAGATRDVIEAPMELRGYRLILADMAGLRDTADDVEAEGVRRAGAWAAAADLRLWVVDRGGEGPQWRMAAELVAPGDLCVVNKMDLDLSLEGERAEAMARDRGLDRVAVSLVGGGAKPVRDWLLERVIRDLSGTDFPATTRARHAVLLRAAKDHLERALVSISEPELAAEDVRMAARSLAMVTGSIGVEDILGEVFANFCIGK
jgi:tRNA modification GTPase